MKIGFKNKEVFFCPRNRDLGKLLGDLRVEAIVMEREALQQLLSFSSSSLFLLLFLKSSDRMEELGSVEGVEDYAVVGGEVNGLCCGFRLEGGSELRIRFS